MKNIIGNIVEVKSISSFIKAVNISYRIFREKRRKQLQIREKLGSIYNDWRTALKLPPRQMILYHEKTSVLEEIELQQIHAKCEVLAPEIQVQTEHWSPTGC